MKPSKILVSGAGIAGPTLAYWLTRSGHQVTVIERAPKLRLGGQNIDISDAAVEIAKRMGIEKTILAHNTTEIGLRFVNDKDEVEAELPKGTATSFTSKYEILRGDLTQILVDLTRAKMPYRFGETIESLSETKSGVDVVFTSGAKENFDLVIAADGVTSVTRSKIVGDTDPYKYLGVLTSYLTIPREPSDTKWARWFNAPGGKVLLVRPDNKGTTRASVNVWAEAPPDVRFSREDAISLVRRELEGVGWEAERISREVANDDDLYLGPVSQVRLSSWSRGRCALVGDAAYCPTPFTGMGTTLAIIGAYVLAGELSRTDDYTAAFERYEKVLRPFVEKIQRVIPGQFRLVYPQSSLGVFAFNKTVAFFTSKPIQRLISALSHDTGSNEPDFKLPAYDWPPDSP